MEQAFPEIGQAKPEDFAKSRTYSAGLDETWGAVIAVLTEFEFPFDLVERESGLVTTEWVTVGPYSTNTGWGKTLEVTLNSLISCNVKDSNDIPADTRCKLNVLVQSGDGGTSVTTNSKFQGWKKPVMKTPYWEPCNSTGELETRIFQAISERLAG